MSESNSADIEKPEDDAPESPQEGGGAMAPGDEVRAKAENAESPAPENAGAFGGISGDEFLKEMLEAEDAGLFSDAGDKTGGGEGAEAGGAELEARLAELEAQLAETREQLLRKAADFENFRKRMNQEKQKSIDFANESLLQDIIPIIDDFERAIKSAESAAELAELPVGKAMLDGITMIEKRLTGQLEAKWGLKRFSAAGGPFDPNFHEAMTTEKSPDVEEPTVLEDFMKGYTLKDRVIRAAKVKVLMPED